MTANTMVSTTRYDAQPEQPHAGAETAPPAAAWYAQDGCWAACGEDGAAALYDEWFVALSGIQVDGRWAACGEDEPQAEWSVAPGDALTDGRWAACGEDAEYELTPALRPRLLLSWPDGDCWTTYEEDAAPAPAALWPSPRRVARWSRPDSDGWDACDEEDGAVGGGAERHAPGLWAAPDGDGWEALPTL